MTRKLNTSSNKFPIIVNTILQNKNNNLGEINFQRSTKLLLTLKTILITILEQKNFHSLSSSTFLSTDNLKTKNLLKDLREPDRLKKNVIKYFEK